MDLLAYLGAFIGAMLEGEVSIVAALQVSQLGYSNFYGILIAAFLGTQIMDWLLYLTGRYNGRAYLLKRPGVQAKLQKMESYMRRYGDWLLFLYRFMYGLRYGLPLLFGISAVPVRKFAFFSMLSTTVWIGLIGVVGHYLGEWLGV